MSGQGGFPPPLTWARILELAAQGHDHYDAALTSDRARQLVASVREHFNAKIAELEATEQELKDHITEIDVSERAANARADAAERRVGITRALDRATKAEAERDQLAARVKQLEYELAGFNAANAGLVRNQCTPEERAVLEAMAAADLGEEDADDAPGEPVEVGEDCYIYTTDQREIVRAELANRAAKALKPPAEPSDRS
jgi:chromosome segregation ATPase